MNIYVIVSSLSYHFFLSEFGSKSLTNLEGVFFFVHDMDGIDIVDRVLASFRVAPVNREEWKQNHKLYEAQNPCVVCVGADLYPLYNNQYTSCNNKTEVPNKTLACTNRPNKNKTT
jgi:hypothetical protein